MATVKTRNADHKARQEVRAAVEAILSARAQIEQTRAAGMYSEEYLAQKRGEIVSGAQNKATGHLEAAARAIEEAEKSAGAKIEKARAVDPALLAVATAQLQMVVGDSLREDPEKLLGLYEASFDNPAERRVVEDLAEKFMRLLPDNPQNRVFAHKWGELQKSLEGRLPEEHREARQDLAEIESVAGYLENARQIVGHAVGRISGDVAQDTMIYGTARHHAIQYEREADGESPIERLPYDYGMDGNRWEGGESAA